jgi:hypothetical protein
MKKIIGSITAVLLAALFVFSFAACSEKPETPEISGGIWDNATYTEDTEIGKGSKTVQVEVKAEDKSVTFTIHTDKETLGEALIEHKIVEGEDGPYGLYIKTVNGILADYDIDQSYWAVSKNGESSATGIDSIRFLDGEHYELVYTKM